VLIRVIRVFPLIRVISSIPTKFAINKRIMDFATDTLIYILASISIMTLVTVGFYIMEFNKLKAQFNGGKPKNNELVKLKLQALERFTLYAERSSLKNLVSRTPATGLRVVDLQLVLLETLKSEYEYNVTQQIYIDPKLWQAIGNLKDQNTYIINQIAGMLPPDTDAYELSKRILEYVSTTDAELSGIVLNALQYEANILL